MRTFIFIYQTFLLTDCTKSYDNYVRKIRALACNFLTLFINLLDEINQTSNIKWIYWLKPFLPWILETFSVFPEKLVDLKADLINIVGLLIKTKLTANFIPQSFTENSISALLYPNKKLIGWLSTWHIGKQWIWIYQWLQRISFQKTS